MGTNRDISLGNLDVIKANVRDQKKAFFLLKSIYLYNL